MKIAILQTNPQSNFKLNLKKITALIKKSAQNGASVVVCPETFLFMGDEQERKAAWPLFDSTLMEHLKTLAKELNVCLIAGSMDEVSHTKAYNTCTTFNQKGDIIGKYRKLHLFNLFDQEQNPIYCESNVYEFGEPPEPYQLSVQNETWDALNIICYDIRFPEIIRCLHKPFDIIFVPAAFTWQTGNDHWEVLLRARAIENQCFVVACNQTGFSHNGTKRTYGNSMVIDPWGKVMARLGEEEDILFCEISKQEVMKVRAKLPALQDIKIFR